MSKLRKSINFTQMCLNEQSDIPLVLVRCRRHLTGEGLAHARVHLQSILEMFSFLQTQNIILISIFSREKLYYNALRGRH